MFAWQWEFLRNSSLYCFCRNISGQVRWKEPVFVDSQASPIQRKAKLSVNSRTVGGKMVKLCTILMQASY